MNRSEWDLLINDEPILLDGATGSNLMKAGMPAGVCPEEWAANHPEEVIALQKGYVESGTRILYAPTFTANRPRLSDFGLEKRLKEINTTLVQTSRKAAAGRAYVAGDVSMTGQSLYPMGTLRFQELVDIYKEQIAVLAEAGVDLIIIETMMSLQETRAALIAAKEVSNLPVMVTMTFEAPGRTLYGTSCETAAVVLENLGADAVGINCSEGPAGILPLIERMKKVTSLPLIAKPNAGKPQNTLDGSVVYDMEPEEFAKLTVKLYEAGATFLGGCCGTTPEYIRALADELSRQGQQCQKQDIQAGKASGQEYRYLATEREVFEYPGKDSSIFRIVLSEHLALADDIRGGDFEELMDLLEEAEDYDCLVFNFDQPEQTEVETAELFVEMIENCVGMSHIPWGFESESDYVREQAERIYPGMAYR